MNIHKLNYIFHREFFKEISYDIRIPMCNESEEYEAISDNWEEVTCESCFSTAPQEIKERFKTSNESKNVEAIPLRGNEHLLQGRSL